jgi:hypothetical protein
MRRAGDARPHRGDLDHLERTPDMTKALGLLSALCAALAVAAPALADSYYGAGMSHGGYSNASYAGTGGGYGGGCGCPCPSGRAWAWAPRNSGYTGSTWSSGYASAYPMAYAASGYGTSSAYAMPAYGTTYGTTYGRTYAGPTTFATYGTTPVAPTIYTTNTFYGPSGYRTAPGGWSTGVGAGVDVGSRGVGVGTGVTSTPYGTGVGVGVYGR